MAMGDGGGRGWRAQEAAGPGLTDEDRAVLRKQETITLERQRSKRLNKFISDTLSRASAGEPVPQQHILTAQQGELDFVMYDRRGLNVYGIPYGSAWRPGNYADKIVTKEGDFPNEGDTTQGEVIPPDKSGKAAPISASWGDAPVLAPRQHPLIRITNQDAAAQSDAERTKVLKKHIFGLAIGAEREETQLAATVAALNRFEGMPMQRTVNVNANADVTAIPPAQLEAELAELERKALAHGGV